MARRPGGPALTGRAWRRPTRAASAFGRCGAAGGSRLRDHAAFGRPSGRACAPSGGTERPAEAADHRYRIPAMNGAELTTASEAKPSWLSRLDSTTGTTPNTSSSTPATPVRFKPSRATAAPRTKLMIARIGPWRSSNARHPCGSTANQTLTPTTAAISTANRPVAQSGRYQASAARTTSGSAQAATHPSAVQPPGSANVSPTTNSPKNAVTNAITPKPARLRMRARCTGSGCRTTKTTAKIKMTATSGNPRAISHLDPVPSPGTPSASPSSESRAQVARVRPEPRGEQHRADQGQRPTQVGEQLDQQRRAPRRRDLSRPAALLGRQDRGCLLAGDQTLGCPPPQLRPQPLRPGRWNGDHRAHLPLPAPPLFRRRPLPACAEPGGAGRAEGPAFSRSAEGPEERGRSADALAGRVRALAAS